MAVIVRPRFTAADIKKLVRQRKKRIEEAILLALTRAGEQFVASARQTRTYKDRTGNLRSSICYVILKNGMQVSSDFLSTGGKKGVSAAKEIIREAKQDFPTGYVLIGVAGMNYAAAVESKGFDVITSTSLEVTRLLRTSLKRIANKSAA